MVKVYRIFRGTRVILNFVCGLAHQTRSLFPMDLYLAALTMSLECEVICVKYFAKELVQSHLAFDGGVGLFAFDGKLVLEESSSNLLFHRFGFV